MTIDVGDSLRRWWPALLPALAAAYHTVSPQITAWVSAHPSASVYVAFATVFVATLLKSPIPSQNGTASQSLQRAIARARNGK
jgi:hypothetical protein